MTSLPATDAPLRGPFFTRAQAARRAGLPELDLAAHPGALRIEGPFGREEAYPACQFAVPGGFVRNLPEVVEALVAHFAGGDVASWVQAPQGDLGGQSIVGWLAEGRDPTPVMALVRVVCADGTGAAAA